MAREITIRKMWDGENCPVCGEPMSAAETGELVRAWPGKYAHAGCASYERRPARRERRRSHPLYRKFTRT